MASNDEPFDKSFIKCLKEIEIRYISFPKHIRLRYLLLYTLDMTLHPLSYCHKYYLYKLCIHSNYTSHLIVILIQYIQ